MEESSQSRIWLCSKASVVSELTFLTKTDQELITVSLCPLSVSPEKALTGTFKSQLLRLQLRYLGANQNFSNWSGVFLF